VSKVVSDRNTETSCSNYRDFVPKYHAQKCAEILCSKYNRYAQNVQSRNVYTCGNSKLYVVIIG